MASVCHTLFYLYRGRDEYNFKQKIGPRRAQRPKNVTGRKSFVHLAIRRDVETAEIRHHVEKIVAGGGRLQKYSIRLLTRGGPKVAGSTHFGGSNPLAPISFLSRGQNRLV